MPPLPFDKNVLISICQKYQVANASLFGSIARGEGTPRDIDLLVSFTGKMTLFKLAAMKRELTAALGREVDLVPEGAISPYLTDAINREKQVIYAA
jgi:predicted nucleotidyltransferase